MIAFLMTLLGVVGIALHIFLTGLILAMGFASGRALLMKYCPSVLLA